MPLGDQATNVKRQVSASKLPTLDHSEFALNEVFMTLRRIGKTQWWRSTAYIAT